MLFFARSVSIKDGIYVPSLRNRRQMPAVLRKGGNGVRSKRLSRCELERLIKPREWTYAQLREVLATIDRTHWWLRGGECKSCGMRVGWEGAADRCPFPITGEPGEPSPLLRYFGVLEKRWLTVNEVLERGSPGK